MKSTTFFSTSNGNSYLFDVKKQYLLNIHPIIEQIHNSSNDIFSESDITKLLYEKYPELTDSDIRMYQEKYSFLKSFGFFNDLNTDEMLTENATPNTDKIN